MNQKFKKIWLKNLRSGKFKQGKGYLKKQYKDNKEINYCCLGVLCTSLVAAHLINPPTKHSSNTYYNPFDTWSYDESDTTLSDNIQELVGIDNEIQLRLFNLNDDGLYNNKTLEFEKMTFKRIAAWIEKNL